MTVRHSHFTRDIKPRGVCPACDRYWDRDRPPAPDDKVRHCTDCGAECDMRIAHCECGPDCPRTPYQR